MNREFSLEYLKGFEDAIRIITRYIDNDPKKIKEIVMELNIWINDKIIEKLYNIITTDL